MVEQERWNEEDTSSDEQDMETCDVTLKERGLIWKRGQNFVKDKEKWTR